MKKFMFLIALSIMGLSSCKSSKKTVDDSRNPSQSTVNTRNAERQHDGKRGGRDKGEMFTKLDINKDGRLTKDEVKGPLAERFEAIDTNKDGFISKAEMENAPRPQRGQRPGGGK